LSLDICEKGGTPPFEQISLLRNPYPNISGEKKGNKKPFSKFFKNSEKGIVAI